MLNVLLFEVFGLSLSIDTYIVIPVLFITLFNQEIKL